MKLLIDTSNREKITIGLDEKRFESPAVAGSSQELLPFIVNLLKENKLTLKDITQIKVSTGPGSFTGLRVGVAVADAIGYALKIPVNGKDVLKSPPEIKYK